MATIIALIPARSGSKRIPNKNIKKLCGHPLIAYTIQVALDAKIFSRVIISTDSNKISKIAQYYGAEIPFLRPKEYAIDFSPDIDWINDTLNKLKIRNETYDCFSILRPTSPFRTAVTIRTAWNQFISDGKADSLRAVEKCSQHPAKMWKINGNRMVPIMINPDNKTTPWYSSPYQVLPGIYSQNASLEIAWSKLVLEEETISGKEILPFITKGFEGYDINNEKDWIYAEYLIRQNKVTLPEINRAPYEK
ncbi:acylneuraminate cytidylyltransferase [Candidatus Gottesmanbacteria bacterium RBG_13_37_7]|uniref:Acylneuraminate cytidylyltransferase n=1 Tax=Candidatus Gottesmanbacteria bacterium RBG_13_37_7 TaxID=1798369 RepID=A0A1F5YH14_9BACT|nr:MAG: acylneuraminate cytidylyltransferase [Candidatus Gottesmanbacteria bacterium RBG_13_37_7]